MCQPSDLSSRKACIKGGLSSPLFFFLIIHFKTSFSKSCICFLYVCVFCPPSFYQNDERGVPMFFPKVLFFPKLQSSKRIASSPLRADFHQNLYTSRACSSRKTPLSQNKPRYRACLSKPTAYNTMSPGFWYVLQPMYLPGPILKSDIWRI